MGIKQILEYNLINIGDYNLSLIDLVIVGLIYLIAKLLVFLVSRFLIKRLFGGTEERSGRKFAALQFLKYIVYTFALLLALETVGVNLSVLWAGSAALLVGIGLGLQQTFNDLISGIILLIEGSVEVGDIVIVDDVVGRIQTISIRTSRLETRDKTNIIIPNSKLVGDKVTNWSHHATPSRFQIKLGVSYDSDVDKVKALILQATEGVNKILKTPAPSVLFDDFGDSSLDFVLHFYTTDLMGAEVIKSNLRFKILRLMRENNIEIPFPQRDLWLRDGKAKLQIEKMNDAQEV